MRTDFGERRVRMMVRAEQRPGLARLRDAETQPGQRVVAMLGHTDVHFGRQARSTNRRDHAVAQIRKRVEHGGDEHVARHAADCVEMNMHHGCWRLSLCHPLLSPAL